MSYQQFKLKISSSSPPAPDNNVKKKRRSSGKHQMAACNACKKKRKKCDGGYPSCSGCLSSSIECTVFDITTNRNLPRNYLQQLENTIQQLEKELGNAKQNVEDQKQEIDNLTKEAGKRLDSPGNAVATNPSPDKQDDRKENLEMEIGYITLGAGAESRYIGDSSAYSIAKAITNSINYYKRASHITNEFYKTQDADRVEVIVPPAAKPSMNRALNYLNKYYAFVQCQYSFLDWNWVKKAFQQVMSCNDLTSSAKPEEIFFTYMIFAIGSQLVDSKSWSQCSASTHTKSYYQKALKNIGPLIEVTNLRTVQVWLILSVFSQKMPDGTSIWQTIGIAIRTSVALGLHREPYHANRNNNNEFGANQYEEIQLRYRVFWSAYGMERINGVVLGRPFGISDIDIDAPLPSETPEANISLHVIRLRRIQSSICTFVYKPVQIIDKPEDIDSTRVQIMLELNNWMSTFPGKSHPQSTFETFNWSSISYHNSILLLLRPVIMHVARLKNNSGARLLEWFKVFANSASAVCMNYKDLHTKGNLGYTWLSMHCVFVSGLSFLYCVWLDNILNVLEWKKGKAASTYDTINACSTTLCVFAERWPSSAVFRDTFDRISSAILESQDYASKQSSKVKNRRASAPIGGILEKQSIGIDEYLCYSADFATETQGTSSDTNNQNSFQDKSNSNIVNIRTSRNNICVPALLNPLNQQDDEINTSEFGEMDASLWEFLDRTGDKFLRNIYYDMEDIFK